MTSKSPHPQASAIKLTFTPQAWVNDYSITVDAEGETEWQPSPEWTARMIETHGDVAFKPHDYESDEWRYDDAAPEWIRNWSGPFEVDVEVDDGTGE